MKIYHYHPVTGVFIGSGIAEADPLVADRWLIPAYAVTDVPSGAPDGSVSVWEDGGWTIYEDHRGKTVWVDYDTRVVIDSLGPLPVGATEERPPAPPPTSEEIRTQRNERIRLSAIRGFGGPTMREILHV